MSEKNSVSALPMHIESHTGLLRTPPVGRAASAGRRLQLAEATPSAKAASSATVGQPGPRAGRAAASPPRTVDAIIVATSGPVHRLKHAVELASASGGELVVLCSGGTSGSGSSGTTGGDGGVRASEVLDSVPTGSDLTVHAVDVPDGYGIDRLLFTTSWHVEATRHRTGGLSLERNVGLLVARMLGWRRVLLLGDEIRDLHAAQLAAMTSLLSSCRAVGAPVRDSLDLSVVGHAHRGADGRQDVFVSGSALAVDATATDTFFPDVFRDDWLFLQAGVRDGAVGTVGEVGRPPRDPFADPRRAAAEEFGDMLGEGLLALLHPGAPATVDSEYWKGVLRRRKLFLADIERRLDVQAYDSDPPRPAVYDALAAAERRLGELTGWDLESYVGCWWSDLRLWRERLAGLPRVTTVDQALGTLGLRAAHPVGAR